MTHAGQGAPAWATSRKRGQVGAPVRVPVREEPLQVGRHAEHRGRPLGADRLRHPLRVEATGHHHPPAGQQGADREPQRRGVVQRAEHEVDVVGTEAPEVTLLVDQRLGGVEVEQARPDALGPARRAAGQVQRSTQGRAVERRHGGQQLLEHRLLLDDQRGVEVGEEAGPLGAGQAGVHRHGEDPVAQQRDHRLGVRRGAGEEQHHAVTGSEAVGEGVVHPSILAGTRGQRAAR